VRRAARSRFPDHLCTRGRVPGSPGGDRPIGKRPRIRIRIGRTRVSVLAKHTAKRVSPHLRPSFPFASAHPADPRPPLAEEGALGGSAHMRVAELAGNPKLEGVAVAHLADHEEPPVRRGMRTIPIRDAVLIEGRTTRGTRSPIGLTTDNFSVGVVYGMDLGRASILGAQKLLLPPAPGNWRLCKRFG
jgi:hypothetical protein